MHLCSVNGNVMDKLGLLIELVWVYMGTIQRTTIQACSIVGKPGISNSLAEQLKQFMH